ncbi:PIR protein [Nymphaea thermarum]|nr:PIR protein [Nymphaea thermarum]
MRRTIGRRREFLLSLFGLHSPLFSSVVIKSSLALPCFVSGLRGVLPSRFPLSLAAASSNSPTVDLPSGVHTSEFPVVPSAIIPQASGYSDLMSSTANPEAALAPFPNCKILSDMGTLSADWMSNIANLKAELPPVQHPGEDCNRNNFHPRAVAPTAAQRYLDWLSGFAAANEKGDSGVEHLDEALKKKKKQERRENALDEMPDLENAKCFKGYTLEDPNNFNRRSRDDELDFCYGSEALTFDMSDIQFLDGIKALLSWETLPKIAVVLLSCSHQLGFQKKAGLGGKVVKNFVLFWVSERYYLTARKRPEGPPIPPAFGVLSCIGVSDSNGAPFNLDAAPYRLKTQEHSAHGNRTRDLP